MIKKKLSCIAIDDEPFALALIEDFCEKIPPINLIEAYDNPFEALQYLQYNKPDFVLIDIKMPELSGIQLIKQIVDCPPIIFTTAYSKYAVESYNLNAIDYLLKPFDFDRFYKAITKVEKHINSTNPVPINEDESAFLLVKIDYKNVKILHAQILFIEAMDNYVKIHTAERFYLTQQSMKSILQRLPDNQFCRVHKSYIVALSKINHFSHKNITIGTHTIPIGRTFQERFTDRLKQ
ncbi:MAG: LytR/AlgR family response regulator transcription factor [Saprospiraceae bacterium]